MKGNRKFIIFGIIALAAVVAIGLLFRQQLFALLFQPTTSQLSTGVTDDGQATVLASNLTTPWAIQKLPSGDLLITERPGQLQRISNNGQVFTIEGVEETSEGGLLGLAIHPQFESNNFIYLYMTTRPQGELVNQVARYTLLDDQLADRMVILDNIPASQNHDGGVLVFGPDDKLYIATGDAGLAERAQDIQSLAGKILRINDDGSIPSDNPFGNEVWSYGHRNSQGLAWDKEGRLWSTEHGPSGIRSGRDELNLIIKGGNYGWPVVTGNEERESMRRPIAQSGDDETWAPAGLVSVNDSLFFTGLRGQSLYQAHPVDETEVHITRHLSGQYGRLRAIAAFDNQLIIGTSNNDGRGNPTTNDDRLLQFPIELFD